MDRGVIMKAVSVSIIPDAHNCLLYTLEGHYVNAMKGAEHSSILRLLRNRERPWKTAVVELKSKVSKRYRLNSLFKVISALPRPLLCCIQR